MLMPVVPRRPDPAKHARGRRALLWFAGLLLAGQGLGGYLLDRYGWWVRFPELASRWAEIDRGPRPTILWMGTSRSDTAVRHDLLNRALWERFGRHRVNLFNGSVPAGDPCVMERNLDRVLRHGCRPELLVLEVSPAELGRNSPWVGFHIQRHGTWSDVPGFAAPACRTNNAGRLAAARLMPLYAHRQQLRARLADATRRLCFRDAIQPWALQGWGYPYLEDYGPPPAVPPGLAGSSERIDYPLEKFPLFFRDYRLDGPAVAALERVLGRCAGEGVPVVLVIPAFSRVAREFCARPEIDRVFREYLAGLRRRYSVEVVDLQDCLPDAAFIDLYHVTTAGSVLFSQVALERVLLPALTRHPPADR